MVPMANITYSSVPIYYKDRSPNYSQKGETMHFRHKDAERIMDSVRKLRWEFYLTDKASSNMQHHILMF